RPASEPSAFFERHGLSAEKPMIALLPGSRSSEVERNLPVLAGAARELAKRIPEAVMMTPWASGLPASLKELAAGSSIQFIEGEYRDVVSHASAAAVASGTASLECALMGVPEVVVYKVSRFTYARGRRLVTAPYVALPNVIMGREAVPELIQDAFTPHAVAQTLAGFLAEGQQARERAVKLAGEIRKRLGEGGAYGRAAAALGELTGL
ncbi:MAG: lipid-A-disaccharide synthase, partial [Chloroflexi bacterium]|nr:lipid-A-disaccharide synthase [Chloroflexota bacterium]